MGRPKKTTEKYKQEVYDLVGDEYNVIGEYKGTTSKILIKHNVCSNEYKIFPSSFLSGVECSKCSNEKRRKTHSVFIKEVYDLVGDEYIIIGDYVNSTTYIEVKHSKCDHTYKVKPNNFLQGYRCPECGGTKKKTNIQFKKEIFNLVGDEYILVEEYVNSEEKIKIKHVLCDHVYYVSPSNFLKGRRCPKCFSTPKKTTKQYKDEVYKLVGGEYTVLGEYKNNKSKIKMQHVKCGRYFEMRPSNFISQGNRCPKCHESKGEKEVERILKDNNIKYDQEKKFKDFKSSKNRHYVFDFYLTEYNAIIEYDGEHHYEPARYGDIEYMTKRMNRVQNNDSIKNEYCKNKNISLLRIPYWDFDRIDELILKFVETLNN